ncbi:MAG: hypothetical protein RR058_05615 [Oscillospiraceae bacterium]
MKAIFSMDSEKAKLIGKISIIVGCVMSVALGVFIAIKLLKKREN